MYEIKYFLNSVLSLEKSINEVYSENPGTFKEVIKDISERFLDTVDNYMNITRKNLFALENSLYLEDELKNRLKNQIKNYSSLIIENIEINLDEAKTSIKNMRNLDPSVDEFLDKVFEKFIEINKIFKKYNPKVNEKHSIIIKQVFKN